MVNLPGFAVLMEGERIDQIVQNFKRGYYTYFEILEYLKSYHGKTMSLSTLKRYFIK